MAGGLKDGLASLEVISDTVSGINVFMAGSITNAEGRIQSNSTGSPASYSLTIQAGSSVTNANGLGSIVFGRSFTNTTYFFAGATAGSISVQSSAAAASGLVYVSGLKNQSGLTFYGGLSMPYDWIAVGLI